MILMIDNYDSFVYNLYQLIGGINQDIKVIRNDEMSVEAIRQLDPEAIIISPGPGRPHEAGIIEELIQSCYKEVPMMGVCLGHQAMIESFGGEITYAKTLMHGKSSLVHHDGQSALFGDVPSPLRVARYHSLAGDAQSIPSCLDVIATTIDGEIMAIKHKDYPVYGLQFHPESILTDDGETIMKNFLKEIIV